MGFIRQALAWLLLMPVLCACNTLNLKSISEAIEGAGRNGELSEAEIAAGLKEALAIGTERSTLRIGRLDGFWKNERLRIPLPDEIRKAEGLLRRLGQGDAVDQFHLSLNRAAETAAPEAVRIFGGAIREMTLADARDILRGPDDAATRYFQVKTSATLRERFLPPVASATNAVGVTRRYKAMLGKAETLVPGLDLSRHDLDTHVTNHALDGLFATLAEEEKRIRENPAARTTELLRTVFGAGRP